MTHVLGLSGYARSGKDTIADHLVENYGFEKVSLGQFVYDTLLKLDPIVNCKVRRDWGDGVRTIRLHEAGSYEEAKEIPEVRDLLQRFGTEVGRDSFGPDVWVDMAGQYMEDKGGNFVVPNIRFPNEMEMVSSFGGQTWRVVRPDYGPVNAHGSETALDHHNFLVTIRNETSIADLKDKVDRLVHYYRLDE